MCAIQSGPSESERPETHTKCISLGQQKLECAIILLQPSGNYLYFLRKRVVSTCPAQRARLVLPPCISPAAIVSVQTHLDVLIHSEVLLSWVRKGFSVYAENTRHHGPTAYDILVLILLKQPQSLTCPAICFTCFFSSLLHTQQRCADTGDRHKVRELSYILSLGTKNGGCQRVLERALAIIFSIVKGV